MSSQRSSLIISHKPIDRHLEREIESATDAPSFMDMFGIKLEEELENVAQTMMRLEHLARTKPADAINKLLDIAASGSRIWKEAAEETMEKLTSSIVTARN